MMISIITALMLLVLFLRSTSPPFHVGSGVNDVWSYIHTDAVSEGFSGKILPLNKRTRWATDITTIQSETLFSWGKRPLVVQKTVYPYTNGIITGVNSNWEIKWAF